MLQDGNAYFDVCACKGIRSCLLCEAEKDNRKPFSVDAEKVCHFSYCHQCDKAWPSQNPYSVIYNHPTHKDKPLDIPGILLLPDFITPKEECSLVENIDRIPWVLSQSGRRKQDFGPSANFKKKKIRTANFQGLPHFTCKVLEKISSVPKLKDFRVVELCHLEYVPERGSAIDPHIDDIWLWGEHLITVNLLSDTVLTLTPQLAQNNSTLALSKHIANCDQPFTHSQNGFNCMNHDESFLEGMKNSDPTLNTFTSNNKSANNSFCDSFLPVVQVPLPRRSLLVLFGPARFTWTHAILRENIQARRIAMTFRELSSEFLEGGNQENVGKELLKIASNWICT